MTPEQERALALARARQRKAQAEASGQKAPQSTSPFIQKGLNMVQGAMATREAAQGANQYLADTVDAPRERAGIESPADAFLFNVGNVLTAGGMQRAGNQVVPGKDLGDTAVRESEVNYPMASVLGRTTGYVAPASQGGRVANMAVQDIVTKTGARGLVPQGIREGTGMAARGTRYLGRLSTLAPVGAAQVGAYEGLVEQPVRDFMAGQESTIGGRVRAGFNALANPINYGVLPVASVAGRFGKSLLTGVATPTVVQQAVTRGSGGAVPLSEGQVASDAAQILDANLMNGIDPRGFKLVERILRQSGLSANDIAAVNVEVGNILKTAPDAVAARLTVGQAYAKALYDMDKTQASENILKVLRERRNVTDVKDRSPSIVGDEVRDLRSSQVDFITQSAESNLGAGRRIDIKNAVADTKKQIGAEYERVLAEANPARPEAPALAAIVMGDASKGILARRAKNAGFNDVDAYARARPDEAAHWLRSHLAKAARSAQGRERVDLEDTVAQLDDLLDTNPGYAAARRQYGTESGVDNARDIGNGFIAAARNQGNLDLLLEQIAALPARERDVALLAIRDNLLSPVRGSGEDAPARISQLISVGTLEGLERLGPAGKNLADDLRAIRDENAFLGQIDSGNPLRQSATFSNADAAANAPDLYSGRVARTLNAGGGSSLPADVAISAITGTPIAPFTVAKLARSGLQSIFAPRRQSKEAMTQFLMSRPRNALSGQAVPTDPTDIMPTAGIAPGAERAAEQQVTPAQPTRSFSRDEAGFVNYPVTNALLGGSGGAVAGSYNDINQDGKQNWEDQVAGGMLGIAGMYGVQKAGDALAPLIPKGYVDRLNATKTLSEAADVIAKERFKSAKRIEREATEADWEDAVSEASDALRQEAKRQGGENVNAAMVPGSLTDPNGKPLIVYEELAAQILRSKGIDPDPVYKALLNERGTNAENATFSKLARYEAGQAKAANREVMQIDEGDKYDAAIGIFESLKPPSRLNGLPGLRTDAGNALVGAGVGALGPADSPEERLRNMAGGALLLGAGGRLSRTVGRNALAGETTSAGLFGRKPPPAPPPAAPARAPRNQRFETLRFMVQRQNPGLADDQIDALTEQQYRSIYERPAPGAQMTERDFAQGWERAVREAKQSLEETAGPGNYTAADVEAEAVASYSQTFPGGRGLPEDTMALPLTVAQDGARTMSRGRTYVFEVNGKAFTGATPEEAARRAGDLSPAMGNMENKPTVRKYAIEEDGTQVPYDEAIRSRPKAPPASPESEFARLVTAEQRLNAPARELSEGDLLRLAEPYAKAYAAKGGQGASEIERAAYAVVQRMGGGSEGPIRAGGFAGGGGRKPRAPKPDSPEAIKAAVKQIAKPKPEPTRLERMVEEGKSAAVPPVNTMPAETDAIAARAERMLASGKTPFEIYDQTRVVFIPYNGGNIPIVSQAMGPEEVIRTFYSWLREPPIKRPEWVNDAIRKAPRKKGLLLTEQDQVPAPPASAAPEQPLPKNGIPYGAIAGGALAGALTGIGGGGAAIMGYQMLQDRNRPRNALSGQ